MYRVFAGTGKSGHNNEVTVKRGFTVLCSQEIKTNQLCVKTELTSLSANLCKQ